MSPNNLIQFYFEKRTSNKLGILSFEKTMNDQFQVIFQTTGPLFECSDLSFYWYMMRIRSRPSTDCLETMTTMLAEL